MIRRSPEGQPPVRCFCIAPGADLLYGPKLTKHEKEDNPPPLPQKEERRLFGLLKGGDRAARTVLIEHNLRLVAHIVRKYYTSYQNPDELISIGSLGLIKAIDTFHADSGARFATYAAKCIQKNMQKS